MTALERVLLALLPARAGRGALRRRQGRRSAACSTISSRWPRPVSTRYDATGNIVYEMMAEELALYAMRAMWRRAAAAASSIARRRGAEAIGLLCDPLQPFVANCDAAAVLASAGC